MDGDLSLSQSLGGLRIANPDDASPPSSTQGSIRPSLTQSLSSPLPPASAVNSEASPANGQAAPSLSNELSARRLSTLDFDPESYSVDKVHLEHTPQPRPPIPQTPSSASAPAAEGLSASIPRKQPSQTQRKPHRQSAALPQTYQAQQQAQFPQYPAMIPQSQRTQQSAARPASLVYGPPGATSPLPPRDSSYRLHREGSQQSLNNGSSKKHSQRQAMPEHQAGVSPRDESYTDRAYLLTQKMPQSNGQSNGPFPPRRSSRGVGQGPAGSTRASPYGADGGGPPPSSEEWKERGAAVSVRNETDGSGRVVQKHYKKGVKDFHFGRTLGEGSYSTVMLATDRQTLKEYAIKVLDKRHIIKEKKVKYVNIEKDTLNRLTDHPGVVRLYYTFQDERSLYFVLDLASGGELLGVLKRLTTFDEECTRFYGAQVLDTIDHMHSRGIIHRDLKPENILLDDNMHTKITDFGTAKILDAPGRPRHPSDAMPLPGNLTNGVQEDSKKSFVGTAEYVSPELLDNRDAGKPCDLWAFGCIIYQLLAGRPPFKAANEYLTFQKILSLQFTFPPGFPPVARDLVERLLVLDPECRLTIDHIKNHEFFDGIRWGKGLWEQKAPRLKSYSPPVHSISLNGADANGSSAAAASSGMPPAELTPSHSTHAVHLWGNGAATAPGGPATSRPSPRVVTDLPPPSPLDIEWSPVLTANNERILKLGNQLVLSTPMPRSPLGGGGGGGGGGGSKSHHASAASSGDSSKLSRFFGGGGAPKKRARMVLVTTSARLIVAAADGHEKKSKFECSMLGPCNPKKSCDAKGFWLWSLDAVRSPSLSSFRASHHCLDSG